MERQRVVVVGAGVYGASVAAALVRRGAAVTVVDAGTPAGGTSGATFSWTNASGKRPRAYHDLNVAGMAAHRELAARTPGNDWYHETGNLEWADGDATRAALRRKVEDVIGYGYEARWLTRAETLRLEPGLAGLPPDGIAYFPREGWIDPVRLVAHLLAGIDVVAGDRVTGIDVDGVSAVRAVRLASGRRLAADAVVDGAGPRAADVAALVGLDLPMRNTRGILVVTTPVPAAAPRRVIHAPHIHLRPESGGRLLLHSTDTDDPAAVLAAAATLLPDVETTIQEVRVGERPIPADGLPVLGRVAAVPGFHLAVSHSGATLCLHAGGLVAAEVTGDDQSAALAPYRYERF